MTGERRSTGWFSVTPTRVGNVLVSRFPSVTVVPGKRPLAYDCLIECRRMRFVWYNPLFWGMASRSCCRFGLSHVVVAGECLTCERIKNRTIEFRRKLDTIKFPLRASCITGHHIDHKIVGGVCVTCENRRWRDVCIKQSTSVYDRMEGDRHIPPVLFCEKHKKPETVIPEDMTTACSTDLIPVRPLKRCIQNGVHYFCNWHRISHNAGKRCGYAGFNKCCACHRQQVLEPQGVAASKPVTGNHTTAANASGGSSITTINYYGANYAQAYAPTAQSTDPQSVASAVSSITGPMSTFLASPSVEELSGDVSDRLFQMISGNSAIITQESAAGAAVAYGSLPCYLENQGNSVDLMTRPGPSCDRFYTLETISIDANFRQYVLPFPGCLSNMGVFGQNLQFHYLYRCGWAVHIQLNATPFHSGYFLCAMVPECEVSNDNSGSSYDNYSFFESRQGMAFQSLVNQFTVYPHQAINIRTTNAATIIVPFTNVAPASCFTTHNTWRLVVTALAPLQSPTGTQQTIEMTITVQPLCSQFNGLRNAVQQQGVPTFQIPGSGQFCTTIPNDGIPAYPMWTPAQDFPLPGEVKNLISVARIPTYIGRAATSESTQFGFTVQNTPNDNELWSIDVSLLSNDLEQTYLGRLARMFAYYKGSIVVRFTYTGPKMSSGKLIIAYTPPGGSKPQNREDAMLGTSLVWDFGLQSTSTFVIPYISVSSRRFANMTGNIFSYDGWLTVWYQTPVVFSPNCPTTARVLVTIAAGEDFEFNGFMDTAYYQGLGDQISSTLQQAITNTVEGSLANLPHMPNNHMASNNQLGSVGVAPALEASETGVASVVGPDVSTTIEPGSVTAVHSDETSIANMLSRYWFYSVLDTTTDVKTTNIPLNLNRSSMAVLFKTLLSAITYWRFDLDIVVVPANITTTSYQDVPYMVQYSPPGSITPRFVNQDNSHKGANPKVFSTLMKPPVTLRIPFTCPASYFASHFDGFGTYNGEQYGTCPSNNFGSLFIGLHLDNGLQTKVRFYVYIRPVNIKAYMPRPLMRGNPIASTLSRNRLEVGDIGNFVTSNPVIDVEEQGGDWDDQLPLQYPESPDWADEQVVQRPDIRTFRRNEDPIPFRGFRFHFPRLGVSHSADMHNSPYYRGFVTNSPDWFERHAYFYACLRRVIYELENMEHFVLVRDLMPWMGGIYRFAQSQHPLNYAMLTLLTLLTRHEERYEQILIEQNNRANDDWSDGESASSESGYESLSSVGLSDLTSDSDFDDDIRFQGPIDSLANMAANLAKPTIEVASDSMSEALDRAFSKAVRGIDQTIEIQRNSWWKKALGIVTKLVAVITAISRSGGDPVILASMGAMLSVDLVNSCPFEWARQQLALILEITDIQEQGPSDWLKGFNVAITAGKGIEWAIGKLWELICWIREKLLPAAKMRERDSTVVSKLVERLAEWRACQQNPNLYTVTSMQELARELLRIRDILENRCPAHPVLRNLAPTMTQCSKYLTNTQKRPHEPIGLLIHGPPGTGKSLATKLIATKLAKNLGNMEPYFMPPDPKYFDGYTGQQVVVMDDLGQNPDGEDMKLLCQMISCAEFYTPQADLPDKGRPFVSSFVLASTNNMQLTPPTVAHPKALARRFQIDVNIEVQQEYRLNGKLDVDKALTPCPHGSKSFGKCCPFICGKAVKFVDVERRYVMTLDEIVIEMQKVKLDRTTVNNKLDIFLQGPILKKQAIEKKKPPKEVLELIQSDPGPGRPMLQYALDLGYEIPDDIMDGYIHKEIMNTTSNWKNWAIVAGTLLTLLTTCYFIWRSIPAKPEGAYDGIVQKNLRVPEKRKIEVQGLDPDTQYALSLMKHNLFPIQTATGDFTALGIHGKTFVIPKHAAVEPYIVAGKEITVEHEAELVHKGGHLELVIVTSQDLQDFRDLRPHMQDSFVPTSDCILAINSPRYPRTLVPIGKVHAYGSINLRVDNIQRVIYYHSSTKQGYCGGAIVKAGKILGIHIAGDGANGYAALLLANYFRPQLQGVKIDQGPAPRPCNVNKKTRLTPSVWHDKIKVTKEPAVLRDNDPRCQVQFSQQLFSKYKGNFEGEDPPELDVAIKQYAAQLRPLLPNDVHQPLSLPEVVEGYARLEGLDLNTSPGYPYCTMGLTKRKLIANNYSKLIEGLDLHGYNLPYVTFLKDELRPIEKVKMGNTRLVECSSINDTIRMKVKFGRLFESIISNNGVGTGIAVGCNPDVDWTRYATEMGDNVFAFDYKNFDASLSPIWFRALDKLLKELGFETEDLIHNLCVSKHIYESQMYVTVGGMPSGCSGTSIFNSMINNLILKTAALASYKGLQLDQFKILAYGDDCVMSYPHPLDPEHIAKTASRWGLMITPADKGDIFKEPGPIESVTFLKRGFHRHENTILYHPVFDENEIYQSLAWTKDPSQTQVHVLSLCQLIWHNGKDAYEKFVRLVRSTPVGRALHLPPYELLLREWLDNFH